MTRVRASGAVWERFRQLVFATHGTTCIVCGHGGARTVDHLEPLTEHPEKRFDLANCRPVHGAPYNRCPVCKTADGKGMNCNGIKAGMSLERARRIVAERTADPPAQPVKREPPAAGGRDW